MDVDARYALGAGDRERVRCDAVRLQARLRVHIHLQSLPGVSLTVCDRAEAGGMSRLPQCRPVAVHIPVTRQRSACAPRRVPGPGRNRKTRIPQSTVHARAPIGDQCEWQYKVFGSEYTSNLLANFQDRSRNTAVYTVRSVTVTTNGFITPYRTAHTHRVTHTHTRTF